MRRCGSRRVCGIRGSVALRAAALLAGALAAAPAGAQLDHPDLGDVSASTALQSSKTGKFVETNFLAVDLDASVTALGVTRQTFTAAMTRLRRVPSAGVNQTGSGTLRIRLYEPDKVIRKPGKNLLKQAKFADLFLAVSTPATSFVKTLRATTPLDSEECQAQFTSQDKDGNGSHEKLAWKAICKPDAVLKLGLTDPQRAALKKVFGSDATLKLKGKTP